MGNIWIVGYINFFDNDLLLEEVHNCSDAVEAIHKSEFFGDFGEDQDKFSTLEEIQDLFASADAVINAIKVNV